MPRVLHALSQRPSLTGSGVTLDAMVRHAARAGWDQRVVVGVPADEPAPAVADLSKTRIHPLRFGECELPFPVPGMSDVMPYRSTRFSTMSDEQVEAYVGGWRRHLAEVVARWAPDVIHTHHLWLMSSIMKDVAPEVRVLAHCHATGLRQMELCPHLAGRVRRGCARVDRVVVLHRGHAEEVSAVLDMPLRRIQVIGAGFRERLFHARGREPSDTPRLLFVGKISAAKGLPSLLDAFDVLAADGRDVELHVAGSGEGAEADALRHRMDAMAPRVVQHGHLSQPELARLMRECSVFALPSMYEGLALVIVEAFACGCRLVATALPGVVEQLAPNLGDALELVEPPAMVGVDTPEPAALPAFTVRLREAIERALNAPPLGDPVETRPETIASFTWSAVFERVESIWKELSEQPASR